MKWLLLGRWTDGCVGEWEVNRVVLQIKAFRHQLPAVICIPDTSAGVTSHLNMNINW